MSKGSFNNIKDLYGNIWYDIESTEYVSRSVYIKL